MITLNTKHGNITMTEAEHAALTADQLVALRSATPIEWRGFHYTGNHVNGQNSDNDGREELLRRAGMWIENDQTGRNEWTMSEIEGIAGLATLCVNGKTLLYHVKQHRIKSAAGFGFNFHRTFRIIEVK